MQVELRANGAATPNERTRPGKSRRATERTGRDGKGVSAAQGVGAVVERERAAADALGARAEQRLIAVAVKSAVGEINHRTRRDREGIIRGSAAAAQRQIAALHIHAAVVVEGHGAILAGVKEGGARGGVLDHAAVVDEQRRRRAVAVVGAVAVEERVGLDGEGAVVGERAAKAAFHMARARPGHRPGAGEAAQIEQLVGGPGDVQGDVRLQVELRANGAATPNEGAGAGEYIVAVPVAARQLHCRSRLNGIGAVDENGSGVHARFARSRKDGAAVHIELTLRTQGAIFHVNGSILVEGPSAIVRGDDGLTIGNGFLE